jgi:hypothetical protein
MRKDKLIGLLKLNIGNAGNIPEPQIEMNIALAWEQMLFAIYAQSPAGIERYAKTYFDIAVVKDPSANAFYSELPVMPIRFSDITEGLRRVGKHRHLPAGRGPVPTGPPEPDPPDVQTSDEGYDIDFVPMPVQHPRLINNVDAGQVMDVIGYFIKDTRVWYFRMNPDIKAVDMDIVRSFDEIGYEEDVPIATGGVQLLIGIANEILTNTPYVDPRLRKINLQEI